MALIWQKKVLQADGSTNDYQIKNAGKSLRLYRNKVFHTQYHPERRVTGDIWDLLLVASLKIPAQSRVLILGAGGGAIVNLLQHFISPQQIDVVDLDPTILYLCERFFLKQKHNVKLIEYEAKSFLERAESTLNVQEICQYDLIVEDLYGEENGQPKRAFVFDKSWLDLLAKHLTSDGRLVVNFESSKALLSSPALKTKTILSEQGFRSNIRFSSPKYQNSIALFSRQDIKSSELRQAVLADKLLRKQNANYYMRAIN